MKWLVLAFVVAATAASPALADGKTSSKSNDGTLTISISGDGGSAERALAYLLATDKS